MLNNIVSVVAAVVTTVSAAAGGAVAVNKGLDALAGDLPSRVENVTAKVPSVTGLSGVPSGAGVVDPQLQLAQTLPLCADGSEVANLTTHNIVEGLPAARVIVDYSGGSACVCVNCSGSDTGTPDVNLPPPSGSGSGSGGISNPGSGSGGNSGAGSGSMGGTGSGDGSIISPSPIEPPPGGGGSDTPALPPVPVVPELPTNPDVPALPELPITPELPAIPDVPSLPDVPTLVDGCDLCVHADGNANSGNPDGLASMTSGADSTSIGIDRPSDVNVDAPENETLAEPGGAAGNRRGSVDVRVDDDDDADEDPDIDVDVDVDADDDDEDDVSADDDVEDALDDLL